VTQGQKHRFTSSKSDPLLSSWRPRYFATVMSQGHYFDTFFLDNSSMRPRRSMRFSDVAYTDDSVFPLPDVGTSASDGGLDPNRFAGEQEAAIIREQLKAYEEDLQTTQRRKTVADTRLFEADSVLRLAEIALAEARAARAAACSGLERAQMTESMLLETIRTTRAPLHPIRRTPDVVLQIILEERSAQFWDNEFDQVRDFAHTAQRLPLELASVCRLWRRIALGTPALWSNIVVDLTHCVHGPETADQIGLYLERARVRPMSLFLRIDARVLMCRAEAHGQTLRALKSLVQRCEHIRVRCNQTTTDANEHLEQLFRFSAPSLQTLSLQAVENAGARRRQFYRSDIFGAGDSLQYLEVNSWIAVMPRRTLKGLETMVVNHETHLLPQLRSYLGAAPNLTKLTISAKQLLDDSVFNGAPFTAQQTISHLRLRELELSVETLSETIASQAFSFPNLEHATVRFPPMPRLGSAHGGQAAGSQSLPFSRRLRLLVSLCGHSLQTLHTESMLIDTAFARVLCTLPALATVRLTSAYLSAHFFEMLNDAATEPPPALTHIEFLKEVNWTSPAPEPGSTVRWLPEALYTFVRANRDLRRAIAGGQDTTRQPIMLGFPVGVPVPSGVSVRELMRIQRDEA